MENMEQINSDKCSNIELNFEYLDSFLVQIRRIFTDPIAFGGEVYGSQPKYNGELFHLFSLEHYPTIKEVISHSFKECDEFLIEYPPESHQVPYQVHYDSPDEIPF
jgi:hypothetical protein